MPTASNKSNRQPTFFWQGLLILLPVAVFAALGVIFLQKDKNAVEEEAQKNAKILARQIADYIGPNLYERMEAQYLEALQARELNPASGTMMAITEASHGGLSGSQFNVPMPEYRRLLASLPPYRQGQLAFTGFFPTLLVSKSGELLQPVAYPEVPVPESPDTSDLSDGQRRMRQQAHQSSGPVAVDAWERFLASAPSPRTAAIARLELAHLYAPQGKNDKVLSLTQNIATNSTSWQSGRASRCCRSPASSACA
jgi:hypothetical protein